MMRISGLLLIPIALAQPPLTRDYGRSMTVTRHGIAATSQILASQAGAEMLARGGSAADAAIASNAVLGLVEPMMDGIGGDLFSLYWDAKSGKLYGLNASGWTPRGMTLDYFAKKGVKSMPGSGIDSATVPGCVAGWAAMHARSESSRGPLCSNPRSTTPTKDSRSASVWLLPGAAHRSRG